MDIYEKRRMRVYLKNDEGGEFIFNAFCSVNDIVDFVLEMLKVGWYIDQEKYY